MKIAIDFDGTLVVQDGRRYDDVTTPPEFLPGAREAVVALRAAGHQLVLWSGRASLALLADPGLDPLRRGQIAAADLSRWAARRALNQARHDQMVAFVERELPDTFAAIDDGLGGKPQVDLFIDDKAIRLVTMATEGVWGGLTWPEIALLYGGEHPLAP